MPRKFTKEAASDAKQYFGEEVLEGRTEGDTRWQKGQTGNRKGRPVEPDGLTDMLLYRLKKSGSRRIADKLIQLAEAGNLQAIQYIYDRIEGKPRQSVLQQSESEPLIVQLMRRMVDPGPALEGRTLPAGLVSPTNSVIEAEVREVTS